MHVRQQQRRRGQAGQRICVVDHSQKELPHVMHQSASSDDMRAMHAADAALASAAAAAAVAVASDPAAGATVE